MSRPRDSIAVRCAHEEPQRAAIATTRSPWVPVCCYWQVARPPTMSMRRKTSEKSVAPSWERSHVQGAGQRDRPPTVSMSEKTSVKSAAPSWLRSQVRPSTVITAGSPATLPQALVTTQRTPKTPVQPVMLMAVLLVVGGAATAWPPQGSGIGSLPKLLHTPGAASICHWYASVPEPTALTEKPAGASKHV